MQASVVTYLLWRPKFVVKTRLALFERFQRQRLEVRMPNWLVPDEGRRAGYCMLYIL